MQKEGRRWGRWLVVLALVPGVGGAVTGCHGHIHIGAGATYKETLQKKFLAAKVSVLRLKATSGDIVIAPADGDAEEILIRATTEVSGGKSQRERADYAASVQTTARLEGSTLVVETDTPQNGLHRNASVSYQITVPKRLALELETTSGSIQVKGVAGGLTLHSDSGGVELKEVGGALRVETTSSDIDVEMASALPLVSADLRSESGAIGLTLPSSASAQIDAQTTSGAIELPGDASDEDTDHSEMHTRKQTMGSGSAPITLQTGSGDISLHTTP